MALKHDSFFNLSKGERRATLWLVVVLVILVAARIVQQNRPPRQATGEPSVHETFRQELKEFGDSLRYEQPKASRHQQTTNREPRRPKELDPVPREE